MNIHDYIVTHQRPLNPVRRWGLVQLAATDFGGGEEPPGETDQALWQELIEHASADVKAARLLNAEWPPDTLERADQALDDALGKAEPPPAPARLAGVYGTYAGHGLAVDLYGGYTEEQVQWGPHHGLPIVAPAEGRVELYQIGTPLTAPHIHRALRLHGYQPMDEPTYRADWQALSDGWTCWAADPLQTMFVAVFWPGAPLVIEGTRIGHVHFGHVRRDVKTGSVRQGEPFAYVHDSGVRFEPSIPNARAAHTHCAAGAGTALSPNGDLSGKLAAMSQGWALTNIGTVPGPSEYMTGQWTAGRRTSDFTRAGKPIPPMPPDV